MLGLLEVGGVEGRDGNKSSSEDEFDSDLGSSNEPEAPPPRAHPRGGKPLGILFTSASTSSKASRG